MDGDQVDADADDNGVCLLEMENQLICTRKQNAVLVLETRFRKGFL